MTEEIVVNSIYICKVKKLLQHGAIVSIGDTGKDGFIHISELSNRWVRDVKDVVKEGATCVCKVIRVEPQSTELSIKRVLDSDKKQALKEWSIENRISKMLEAVYGEESAKVTSDIKGEYGSLYALYSAAQRGGKDAINKLKLKKDFYEKLQDFVEKTKKRIRINTEITVQAFGGEGLADIKRFLGEKYSADGNYSVRYTKAPRYMLTVDCGDTKKTIAENKKILEAMSEKSRSIGVVFKFKEIKT
jgi:translation initiation factor 2 subunit 1